MSKKKLKDIQKQIEDLQREKEQLEQQLKQRPECVLADYIHNKCCHYNHTDGCGYFYNDWDNPGYERKRYLTRAESLLTYLRGKELKNEEEMLELAERLIDIINGD